MEIQLKLKRLQKSIRSKYWPQTDSTWTSLLATQETEVTHLPSWPWVWLLIWTGSCKRIATYLRKYCILTIFENVPVVISKCGWYNTSKTLQREKKYMIHIQWISLCLYSRETNLTRSLLQLHNYAWKHNYKCLGSFVTWTW